MSESILTDNAARLKIATSLDQTLFVSAGAGSGKTTALVGRLDALVRSGVPLSNIAAITFTEKAAAELRDRLRTRLAKLATSPDLAGDERDRCKVAIDEVDGAALSTLHSFAQRLLSEHPIEAGLPPGVEVLDEIGSDIEFDDRWRRFIDELLDDPALEQSLLIADAAKVQLAQLRDVAKAFDQNWDLVAERVPLDLPQPEFSSGQRLVQQLRDLGRHRAFCDNPDNRLCRVLDEMVENAAAIEATDDPVELFGKLFTTADPKSYGNVGVKGDWTDAAVPITLVRDAVAAYDRERDAWCRTMLGLAMEQLGSAIAGFILEEAARRRREGRLEFHDLLVLARQLLRDPLHGHAVRTAARGRYQRLLLDEFQDTDPIQIELAVLLAAEPTDGDDALGWSELIADPGRLFFVGDPKQSIYRFRRADIRLYLEADEHFGRPTCSLVTNFRSTEGIVEWVNHVFGQVITAQPESQPEYEGLVAHRHSQPVGPAVTLLGTDPAPVGTRAPDLRHLEAADVVAAIRTAIADGWEVSDDDTGGKKPTRPAKLGDICVLLPARTSLSHLERALQNAHIPFRAEASSLLYGSAEVRDLMAVLRTIDDATDELSLVTALRSPAFGCGDDDLYEFKVEHRGVWNHQAPVPDDLPADHPVGEAMRWLASIHTARTWLTPSELIDRVLRERGLFEVSFAQGRFRDVWRRYRFVLDQARAYGDAVGGALRDYLRWVARQAAEGSRVSETVLPETDDDAVRILTVHASKGLEFPITILSGMTTRLSGRRSGVQVVFPPGSDTYGLHVRKGVTSEEFELHKPLDEQMDHHERLRLLYVACTRAVDHLVVSCRRAAPKVLKDGSLQTKSAPQQTAAELLFAAAARTEWATVGEVADSPVSRSDVSQAAPIPTRDRWDSELTEVLATAARPRVTSATAVARAAASVEAELVAQTGSDDPGVAKEPRDLDLPPWRRGRYGTAIGRAVHGVLQAINLAGSDAIGSVSAAQAAAEGVDDKASIIESLVESALRSPVVVEAAAATHWKEVYVAAPVDDVLLEGYVDLIFERADGLVVVDYKTDYVGTDAELAAKIDRYRLQLGAYAVAVEAATGRSVVDAVFVFCDPDGAREAVVADLAQVALAAGTMVNQACALGPVELE